MNKNNKNKAIISSISPQRFQPYLSESGGDVNKAFELYEKNVRLSAEFYQYLSFLEVCLRNKVNGAMQGQYGIEWLIAPEFPMEEEYKKTVNEVYEKLREENRIGDDAAENMGRVVAGVSLGVWVRLFGKKYEKLFWRRVLRPAFPNYSGPLKRLRNRIYMIKRLRNRIAHHEPIIFHDDIAGRREEILEVIGWMCKDTEEWVRGL